MSHPDEPMAAFVRRPEVHELAGVRALVERVVDETYGGVLSPLPERSDDDDWSLSWVAVVEGTIVGVVLTQAEWVSDLWVLGDYQRHGVGGALLAQGEAEVAARGQPIFRLRVVSTNKTAIEFYHKHGWRVEREFPNERLPVAMLEMSKTAPSS